jgi:fumarate reductase subunit C
MTGVIWAVQLRAYPSFSPDRAGASERAAAHGERIPWIAGPGMALEMATGLLLYVNGNASWSYFGGPWLVFHDLLALSLSLLALTWTSTAFVQAPIFAHLLATNDKSVHRSLVATNWTRTVAWTARAVLVLVLLQMARRLADTR